VFLEYVRFLDQSKNNYSEFSNRSPPVIYGTGKSAKTFGN